MRWVLLSLQFTDEETKAQRSYCPKLCDLNAGFAPRQPGSRVQALNLYCLQFVRTNPGAEECWTPQGNKDV